ncbi:MAG: hypothetical protein R2728_10725 [Chitinophagales bacterium]
MRNVLVLFSLLTLSNISFAQSEHINSIEQVIKDRVEQLSETDSLDAQKIENLKAFQNTIKSIVDIKGAKSFSGNAVMGFNGETTREDDNSLFNLFGGINLDWVLYPGELNLYTLFGVTLADKKLQENVSRIDISYDYLQTKVGNGLMLENYVYINRSTDAFLGIDQRYELGGGFILNHWIDKLNGDPNKFSRPLKSEVEISEWQNVLDSKVTDEDIDHLKSDFQEAYNKNKKSNSKLRIALLTGIFFELQQTSVRDSIILDPTYNFRWVMRPTMDIKLKDGWKVSLRPYFKMPMPWEWQDVVSDSFGNKSARADFLVDFTGRITTQLASQRVEIGFIYNVVYDNAAPRIYIENTNEGTSRLLKNNDLHQSFRMSMSVNLAR